MTLMSELGPRAREILRSGRALNRPTNADRERVANALRKQLGAALVLGETSRSPAPRPRWPFITSVVVGAGLIGGAGFLGHQQKSATALDGHAVVAPVADASPVVAMPTAEPRLAPAAPKPRSLDAPARATLPARPAEDRLAQEVALLTRATSDLHSGHPAEALQVLDEYQRRFPRGLLTEERRSARTQALCSLGREGEAAAELARLPPESLAAARAKQVCDARNQAEK